MRCLGTWSVKKLKETGGHWRTESRKDVITFAFKDYLFGSWGKELGNNRTEQERLARMLAQWSKREWWRPGLGQWGWRKLGKPDKYPGGWAELNEYLGIDDERQERLKMTQVSNLVTSVIPSVIKNVGGIVSVLFWHMWDIYLSIHLIGNRISESSSWGGKQKC